MDPEIRKQAAWMWERWVQSGVDEAEATRRVESWLAAPLSDAEDRGDRPGVVGGTAASLLEGVSLGTSGELYGAARGLAAMVPGGKSPREAFREGLSGSREYLREFGEDHPILRAGADIVGGLGTAVATGGLGLAGRGAVTAGRLARLGAVEGAVVGGIEGAARAEGGLVERGTAGAIGAGLGAGFGGAVGLATPILSRAGATGAGALVGGGVGYAAEGDALGAGVGAAGGAGAGRLGGRLAGRLVQRIGPSPAGERAAVKVARSLGREGVTPEQLSRVASEAPETSLLEVSGRVGNESPVQRLARGAQSFPSRGSRDMSTFLRRQSDEAPARIREELQRKSGLTFENVHETLDDVAARQQRAARELYDEAYTHSVTVTDNIADALSDEAFRDAYARGQRIARLDGVDLPDLPDFARLREMGGNVSMVTNLPEIPVQGVDYMKRGLDDLIESRTRAGSIGRTEGRALRNRLRSVLAEVDEQVPVFGEARRNWAGEQSMQDMMTAAMQGGDVQVGRETVRLRAFLQESPEKLGRALEQMTPSERDFYLRGALEDVRDMLARSQDTRADLSRLLIGRSGGDAVDTDLRKRLRLLFNSDRDMQEFVRSMLDERGRAEAGGFILGGSPTQRIAAEQADLSSGAVPSLNPRTIAIDALRNRVGRHLLQLDEETVDALAPMLTGPLSETAPLIGRNLDEYGRRLRARSATIGRAGAAQGGAAAGAFSNDDPARR